VVKQVTKKEARRIAQKDMLTRLTTPGLRKDLAVSDDTVSVEHVIMKLGVSIGLAGFHSVLVAEFLHCFRVHRTEDPEHIAEKAFGSAKIIQAHV
jgi:hypothetical protein